MIRRTGVALSAFGLLIGIPLAGWGAEPTFTDLLARAHTQASAGHQWGPPGDNVAETFMALVNLLPQATPEQLSDFEALLREQQKQIATSSLDSVATASPDVKGGPDQPSSAGASNQQPAPAGLAPPVPGTNSDQAANGAIVDGAAGSGAAGSGAAGSGATANVATADALPAAPPIVPDAEAAPSESQAAAADRPDVGSPATEIARPDVKSDSAAAAMVATPASPGAATTDAADGGRTADASPPKTTSEAMSAPANPGQNDELSRSADAAQPPSKPAAPTSTAQSPEARPAPAASGTERTDSSPPAPQPAAATPPEPVSHSDRTASITTASPPPAQTPPPSPPITVATTATVPEPAAQPSPRLPTMAPQPVAPPAQPNRSAMGTVPKQAGTNAQVSRAFANAMFARGRAAEEQGDISGARRFYTAAAQNGLADAARAVSRLYDPIYLREKTIGGIAPDPQLSRQWHDRAVEMDAQSSPANPSSSHPQALTAR